MIQLNGSNKENEGERKRKAGPGGRRVEVIATGPVSGPVTRSFARGLERGHRPGGCLGVSGGAVDAFVLLVSNVNE